MATEVNVRLNEMTTMPATDLAPGELGVLLGEAGDKVMMGTHGGVVCLNDGRWWDTQFGKHLVVRRLAPGESVTLTAK